MIRATVTLTTELADVLVRESRRQHITLSECIRLLLAKQLGIDEPECFEPSTIRAGAKPHTNAERERLFADQRGHQPDTAPPAISSEVGRREVAFAGLGSSGYLNTAEDMEELLKESWGNGPTRNP
jgi:hypothetical protein